MVKLHKTKSKDYCALVITPCVAVLLLFHVKKNKQTNKKYLLALFSPNCYFPLFTTDAFIELHMHVNNSHAVNSTFNIEGKQCYTCYILLSKGALLLNLKTPYPE